jgi:hypothetical protein
MNFQMILVISSPSSSTTGLATLILGIAGRSFLPRPDLFVMRRRVRPLVAATR